MWIRDIGISLKLDTVQGSIRLIIKYKDFGAPTVQWRRQRPTSCSRGFEYQLLCPYFFTLFDTIGIVKDKKRADLAHI